MKKLLFLLFMVGGLCLGTNAWGQLLPKPISLTQRDGEFILPEHVGVKTNLKGNDKTRLLHAVETALGVKTRKGAVLELRLDKKMGKGRERTEGAGYGPYEGYTLEVTPKKVIIRGGSAAGLFYGVQTLGQLAKDGKIPAVSITDEPKFGYRGFMLDCSRHFFGKDFILKQMREMARYKLNRLHLHLTDAAGWRLQMDKYPELTQLAGFRTESDWNKWWRQGTREYVKEGTEGAYGGYLTKDDVREILAVAADNFIEVLPEIEMPGHSEEVMTVYPELSCDPTHPAGKPNRHSDFCIGNEKCFEFIEDVLREVAELFPSKYLHIGGDEAGKWAWKSCPKCQALAKKLGLKATKEASVEDQLQSYFIQRVEKIVEKLGRKMIGWDEILEGGLAENATVMSWRGEEGGIKTVKSGHHAVMTPSTYLYLDYYQDAPQYQPEAIGGYLPLESVYSYKPIPAFLSEKEASLIDGVQANLWTEYIKTPEHCEFMAWPRLLALAEIAWTPQELRTDYEDFLDRATQEVAFLKGKGFHPFAINYEVGNRREYREPIKHLALGKKVTYHAPYSARYVANKEATLTDGLRGGWSYNDSRWQGFIDRGRVDVTIDLGEPTDIREVYATFMQMPGPNIYHPATIDIQISDDNEHWTELYHLDYPATVDEPYNFKDFGWWARKGSVITRYIHYKANCSEIGGFQFTDEIIVR